MPCHRPPSEQRIHARERDGERWKGEGLGWAKGVSRARALIKLKKIMSMSHLPPPPITRPSLLTGDITTHVDGHHNSQSASQKHGEEVAFGFLTSDSLGHSPLGDELVGEER